MDRPRLFDEMGYVVLLSGDYEELLKRAIAAGQKRAEKEKEEIERNNERYRAALKEANRRFEEATEKYQKDFERYVDALKYNDGRLFGRKRVPEEPCKPERWYYQPAPLGLRFPELGFIAKTLKELEALLRGIVPDKTYYLTVGEVVRLRELAREEA